MIYRALRACILVYGPGKYKFMDFIKTGVLLTVILMLLVLLILPMFWPFYAGIAPPGLLLNSPAAIGCGALL